MDIKVKKQNPDGIVRLETSGEIKEVMVDEDILNPKKAKAAICFRGKKSSGIINLSLQEIESLYKNVVQRTGIEKIKIIK